MFTFVVIMPKQTYQQLRRNEAQFQSQTGLSLEDFDRLFPYFEAAWKAHNAHFTIMNKERIRPPRQYKNKAFEDTESMLVFMLFYLKTNSLQETLAAMFGMNQPQANTWIHLLKKILMTALQQAKSLPCRDFDSLQKYLHAGQDILLDGSERPIPRPADKDVQKEYYSGKKNAYH
jgi:hypothetical protein